MLAPAQESRPRLVRGSAGWLPTTVLASGSAGVALPPGTPAVHGDLGEARGATGTQQRGTRDAAGTAPRLAASWPQRRIPSPDVSSADGEKSRSKLLIE